MQISIIIGIILMVVGGQAVTGEDNQQGQYWAVFADKPWLLAGITGGLIVLFAISVFSVNSIIAAAIRKGRYVSKAAKIISLWRTGTVFLAGIFSFVLGWGRFAEYITDIYMLQMLLWMLPFIILIFLQLYFCYELDIYCRKGCLPAQCDPDSGIWSRSGYLTYHLRHNLLGIIVPILFITFMADAGTSIFEYIDSRYPSDTPDSSISYLKAFLSVVAIGLAYLFAPLILRYVWMTSSMPQGPQRDHLEAFCKSINLKYSNILLWKTYRMVGNAAVTGLLPVLRYVIVSDRLLENLTPDQLRAVFGHEAGHIYHKHMPLLLLAVISIISMFGMFVEEALAYVPEYWPAWSQEAIGYSLGLISLLIGLSVFGFISRNLECEADIYGAEAADNFQPGIDGRLSSIGSAIMTSSLQRLSFINGMSVTARSWRHSSLSNRMELLFELSVKPGMLKSFRKKLRLIKLGVILVFVLTVLLLAW